MAKRRVTIADVAARAGVGKSTVSYVMNASRTRVPISEKTRERVLEAARECGYHPNAAARALSTSRTGHIGFILSDRISGGWANAYFAQIFTGVEAAARRRGYGLNASLYNLSSIDSFVFPARVGQRSVDGLVLTGHVEAAVAERFREFQIPCVCIGDDTEVAGLIPTIATDIVSGTLEAVRHAAELGHKNVCYCRFQSRRGREVADALLERMASDPLTSQCRMAMFDPADQVDYRSAEPLLEWWRMMPEVERPTVILTSDQAALAFLGQLTKHGLACPRDVSVISTCDSDLCRICHPALTAMDLSVTRLGEIAVELLIDHLEQDAPLTPQMSHNDHPCRLVVRDSCSRPGQTLSK